MTTRITKKHLMQNGICMRGARGFFKERDINWQEFLDKGIPSEIILGTGDARATKIVGKILEADDGREE